MTDPAENFADAERQCDLSKGVVICGRILHVYVP